METTKICGFEVSTGSLSEHICLIHEMSKQSHGAWIVTLNTEMLSLAKTCSQYRDLIRNSDLIVADGMPIVWATRRSSLVNQIPNRTTGVDLVEAHFRSNIITPFAIIGGKNPAETLKTYKGASEKCKYLFDGQIDFSSQQIEQIVSNIKNTDVKIIYIALGAPKQDRLASRLREKLPDKVLIGVGGSFEILSPTGRRAPQWMRNYGLEWLYRLTREPRRLWKRYLLHYPTGIFSLLRETILRHSEK